MYADRVGYMFMVYILISISVGSAYTSGTILTPGKEFVDAFYCPEFAKSQIPDSTGDAFRSFCLPYIVPVMQKVLIIPLLQVGKI